MKLLKVITNTPRPVVKKISAKHWILIERYSVLLVTDEGTLSCDMMPGWLTDFRSGSGVLDVVVPKFGNPIYMAVILCHDFLYSGYVSRLLADEILYQGIRLAGYSRWRASAAYWSVRAGGKWSYYPIEKPLKGIYQHNRLYEKFGWLDKP